MFWIATAISLAQSASVASANPYHGPVGTLVTISGQNLDTASAVYFNNVPVSSIQVLNAWYIKVTVPSGATTGKIKVVNPKGSYTTSSDWMVDQAQPTIASFNPYHGTPGTPGTEVTISGSNLGTTSMVCFNGRLGMNLVVVNDWTVKASVPLGTTTGKISLSTSAGSVATSSDFIIDSASGGTGGSSGGSTGGSTGGTSGGSTGGTSGGSTGGSTGGSGGGSGWVDPPAIDPPVGAISGHPRIFLRPQDVTRIQTWAVPTNTRWNAMLTLATSAKNLMDGGTFTDSGEASGTGAGTPPYESVAELFAFMSLVHPDASARTDYANRAYTLIMTVINEAAKGQADGLPFRSSDFATFNRASWWGESFPAVVDWCYNKFSAADKAKIRTVFLRWIQDNIKSAYSAHPTPVGVTNDPSLLADKINVRWATNNYYCNHLRQIGLMSMALDAADDIPTVAGDPAAGTLRRFVGNSIGAWMYQTQALEKTDGVGGISPEGLGYAEISQRGVVMMLLAMNTAGIEGASIYGPAANMINDPFWDHEFIEGYMHILSPMQTVQENWIGQTYLPYLFSDNSDYRNPDYVRVLGSLAMQALNVGNMVRYGKIRWMIDNLPAGGVSAQYYKMTSAMSGSAISLPIWYFMSCDPNYVVPADPRPLMSTDYFDSGLGIFLSRTDWTPGASWMTFKASYNSTDHQHSDGNSLGFYRNGEWLSKNVSGYGNNVGGSAYQNTLAIENPGVTSFSQWTDEMAQGSQFGYDPIGDPIKPLVSSGVGFATVQCDDTNLYNCSLIPATDVAHASRSAVFLKPDVIVSYERASSKSLNRYKRSNINSASSPVINGHTATAQGANNQQLVVDALLPLNTTLTSSVIGSISNERAVMEPMNYRLVSEDLSKPQTCRFLNVMQGVTDGHIKQNVSLTQSISGTQFDGALVGNTAVCFKQDLAAPFTSVSFSIPSTVTKIYLTGLTPNSGYTVTVTPNGANKTISVVAAGAAIANSGGVLIF